jgi:hypothetical protein
MFRVVLSPIIRGAYNCIYSIWYLSHRYCYLPLSWKSWNQPVWVYCGWRTPRQVAVTVWQIPDTVDAVVCAPDDGCKYHPKHVEQFPDINKLCNFASCWIYIYWNILTMHGLMNVKSPNNTSNWQMGFNSVFKGLNTYFSHAVFVVRLHITQTVHQLFFRG